MKQTERFSRTNLQMSWRNVRWALSLSWHTDKPLLSALVMAALLLSLVPAGLAITVRALVDVIASGLRGSGESSAVWFWLSAGLAVTLVDVLGRFVYDFLLHRFSDELNLRVNNEILAHAARLDVAQFEDPQFQDVLERVRQDVSRRFSLFITKLLWTLNQALQMVWLTVVLAAIEPLVVLVLAGIAFPYLALQWWLAKYRYTDEHYRITKIRWTQYLVEHLTKPEWVPETKLLNLGPLFLEKYNRLMSGFRNQNRAIYGRMLLGSSLFGVVASVAFFLTFARVAFRTLSGELGLGDLAIYGGATARLRNSLDQAISNFTGALEQSLHIAHLREFLGIEPQIIHQGSVTPAHSDGRIEVQNLTFAYPGSQKRILNGISFTIEPGESLAIVGRNGAGKTTLVKLLARLYEPTGGRICLDGVDVRQLARNYLQRQVAFVFQHYGRYEATAADNIAYGDWERLLHDRAAITEVAQMAGVAQMIAGMPDGLDTMLGRWFGDYTLSGGQWQSLAIARAFARRGCLIVLDEPTSNLDAMSEFQLYTRFRELAAGRTTILISHRFSTVSMANRIIVLDNGEIIETGTHQELLAQNGLYAHMYALHRRKMGGMDGEISE